MKTFRAFLVLFAVAVGASAHGKGREVFGTSGGWEASAYRLDGRPGFCGIEKDADAQSRDFSGYGVLSSWLKFNLSTGGVEFFAADAGLPSSGTDLVIGDRRFPMRVAGIEGWVDPPAGADVLALVPEAGGFRVEFGAEWIEFSADGAAEALRIASGACH